MIFTDLHCHSLMSDGELIPSEHIRRAEMYGYDFIAITDHADSSNLEFIIKNLSKVASDINKYSRTKLIPGIELTHVAPELIAEITKEARKLGAKIVVCHGETIVEPVKPGSNRAAIEACVDILAHPGFITVDEVLLAKKNNVFLEISGRKGHSLTNGHVAKLAMDYNAKLVINSDGHSPSDFMTSEHAIKVGLGAGLCLDRVEQCYKDVEEYLIKKIEL
jgi:histidinol phosphatase-like PHP family hydrolase